MEGSWELHRTRAIKMWAPFNICLLVASKCFSVAQPGGWDHAPSICPPHSDMNAVRRFCWRHVLCASKYATITIFKGICQFILMAAIKVNYSRRQNVQSGTAKTLTLTMATATASASATSTAGCHIGLWVGPWLHPGAGSRVPGAWCPVLAAPN